MHLHAFRSDALTVAFSMQCRSMSTAIDSRPLPVELRSTDDRDDALQTSHGAIETPKSRKRPFAQTECLESSPKETFTIRVENAEAAWTWDD